MIERQVLQLSILRRARYIWKSWRYALVHSHQIHPCKLLQGVYMFVRHGKHSACFCLDQIRCHLLTLLHVCCRSKTTGCSDEQHIILCRGQTAATGSISNKISKPCRRASYPDRTDPASSIYSLLIARSRRHILSISYRHLSSYRVESRCNQAVESKIKRLHLLADYHHFFLCWSVAILQ